MYSTWCECFKFYFCIRFCSNGIVFQGYKQNWKAANNHFQRYSDVKPREERRPSVMDLANQANVSQTINGWKIFHLSSQMEDLVIQNKQQRTFVWARIMSVLHFQCDLESQVYDKLSTMLQVMEAHNQSVDVDRVNDLIKVSEFWIHFYYFGWLNHSL